MALSGTCRLAPNLGFNFCYRGGTRSLQGSCMFHAPWSAGPRIYGRRAFGLAACYTTGLVRARGTRVSTCRCRSKATCVQGEPGATLSFGIPCVAEANSRRQPPRQSPDSGSIMRGVASISLDRLASGLPPKARGAGASVLPRRQLCPSGRKPAHGLAGARDPGSATTRTGRDPRRSSVGYDPVGARQFATTHIRYLDRHAADQIAATAD